ncbi:flagellar biosynthetic protein FliO [Marinobacterium jannaschii]|uniref:flagellar biosynthetic protein FliO n=1 Tax=Marinobacterium jannaschii TaxID=64970 RepID=UPI000688A364|nr:flagellar biosynthetic protein FliO [Marinobacterium jannaschii]
MRIAYSLLMVALPLSAAEKDSVPDPFAMDAVVQLVTGLAIVIALILVLAWVARRFMGAVPQQKKLKTLAVLPLGTREKAVLVEVGGQQMLLGVAPGRVNLLTRFDEPVISEPEGEAFASRLRDAVQQRTPGQ